MSKRIGIIDRKTGETEIKISINLDGKGEGKINTDIGFFNHMLELFSFHSNIDIELYAKGDTYVCDHHLVEDIGIALGQCFLQALGDKSGIKRYGTFFLPMDETLAQVSLDISGRSYLVFNAEFNRESIGNFSTEMVKEFFRAFAYNSKITLHSSVLYGSNDHHKIEALFKALGRALKEAIIIEADNNKIPSSKGVI